MFKSTLILLCNLALFETVSAMSIDLQIASRKDDAEELISKGRVTHSSSDLELGRDKRGEQIVAMRFNQVDISKNSKINHAYIQYTVDEKSSTPTRLLFEGEATDNAKPLSKKKFNLSKRLHTVNNSTWIPAPWKTVGASGADQRTVDLGPIIQEIINRKGWSAGNSLVLLVTGSGVRTAESYNGKKKAAPVLHINFADNPEKFKTPSDKEAPIVSIAKPLDYSYFKTAQTVNILAEANDNVAIKKVEFIKNGQLLFSDSNAPYEFNWDIDSAENGDHTLIAKAYDSSHNLAHSNKIQITVNIDITSPTISIINPVEGTTYNTEKTVTIMASASDDNAVSKVEFYDNGVLQAIDNEAPFQYDWNFTALDNDNHLWTAKAIDSAGNVGVSDKVACIVDIAGISNQEYVYYVAPNGNDNNAGTEAKPWASIVYAAQMLIPGDTVYVKSGIYEQGDIVPLRSGTAQEQITYSVYPGHEGQVILHNNQFELVEVDYITVNGFKFVGTDQDGDGWPDLKYGVYVANSTDTTVEPLRGIIISNNHTDNTRSSGIQIKGVPSSDDNPGDFYNIDGITVAGNTVERCTNGGYNECITIAYGVHNAEVMYNTVMSGSDGPHGNEGIDFKQGVFHSSIHHNTLGDWENPLSDTGIYIDGGDNDFDFPYALIKDIHIYNNLIINTPSTGLGITTEGTGGVEDIYVYNNVINGADRNGIGLYKYSDDSNLGWIDNVQIINNTITHSGREAEWFGGIRVKHEDATNIIVRNNISWNNAWEDAGIGVKISGSPGAVQDNNLCKESYCSVQWNPEWKNPVDSDQADFRLQDNSPASNAGLSKCSDDFDLVFDFDDSSRLQGLKTDLGAFELQEVK